MKSLYLFLVFITLCIIVSAQNPADTNKYKITLPSFWKKSARLLQQFDTTLQKHWNVLEGKKICTKNCNPKFIISLEISEPTFGEEYISDYVNGGSFEKYTYNLPVRFSAKLVLRNRKGDLLSEIHLVDSTEEHILKTDNTSANRSSNLAIPEVDPPYTGTDPVKKAESEQRRSQQMEARRNLTPQSSEPPRISHANDSQKYPRRKADYLNSLYSIIDEKIKLLK